MNLLLKVSCFFYDLQVNVLITKTFLVLESLVNYRNYPNLVRIQK